MSDRIAADLTYDRIYRNDIDSMFYHVGDASEPLRRWQQLLSETIPHGWSKVQNHAKEVMRLIADPRVLFVSLRWSDALLYCLCWRVSRLETQHGTSPNTFERGDAVATTHPRSATLRTEHCGVLPTPQTRLQQFLRLAA